MQRAIGIVVAVNDEEHATTIRQDLIKIVRKRTTIFYVTDAYNPIDEYGFVLDVPFADGTNEGRKDSRPEVKSGQSGRKKK